MASLLLKIINSPCAEFVIFACRDSPEPLNHSLTLRDFQAAFASAIEFITHMKRISEKAFIPKFLFTLFMVSCIINSYIFYEEARNASFTLGVCGATW